MGPSNAVFVPMIASLGDVRKEYNEIFSPTDATHDMLMVVFVNPTFILGTVIPLHQDVGSKFSNIVFSLNKRESPQNCTML